MDIGLKDKFLAEWGKYFPGAELPVAFWYTDEEPGGEYVAPPPGFEYFLTWRNPRPGRARCWGIST